MQKMVCKTLKCYRNASLLTLQKCLFLTPFNWFLQSPHPLFHLLEGIFINSVMV